MNDEEALAAASQLQAPASTRRLPGSAARPARSASARRGGGGAGEERQVEVAAAEVAGVRAARDPSLPPGAALWLQLASRPAGLYLVAATLVPPPPPPLPPEVDGLPCS